MFNALPILCMLGRTINLQQTAKGSVGGGERRGKWTRELTVRNGKRNYQQKKVWSGD